MAYITNKTTTASGNNISLNNMINYNIQNLQLLGDTNQTGTPSPSSPVNIDTVTGQQDIFIIRTNYFNAEAISNTNIVVSDEGKTITMPIVTSGNGYTLTNCTLKELCPALQVGDEVYLNATNNVNNNKFIYLASSDYLWNYGTSRTITATDLNGNVALYANRYSSGDTTQKIISDLRITKESTDEFEPYKNRVYGINLGKNLLGLTNGEKTAGGITGIWNNGNFTFSGTASNTYASPTNNTNISLPAGNYVFSISEKLTIQCRLKLRYDDNTSQDITLPANNLYTTFTTAKEIKQIYVWLNGLTVDTYYEGNINCMLEKGTMLTEYAPYFTPIELCKIGDYQDKIKKSTGKNLFDKDNINKFNGYFESNYIITASDYNRIFYISCSPNTTYTITQGTSTLSNHLLQVATSSELPEIGVTCSAYENIGTNTTYTYTTNSTAQYLVFRIRSGDDTESYWNTIQIELGDTATEYEPFGKVWYIHKEIGKVILTGASSEDWSTDGTLTNTRRYTLNIQNALLNDANNVKLSNYFYYTYNYNLDEEHFYINNNGKMYLFSTYTNTNDFKTWLSTHNTIVYYVLETPTNTIITNETLINELEQASKLKLYDGINNVIVDGNLGSVLSFIAYTNENPYVDILYGGDSQNKARIWFNDVEMLDFGTKCEKITKTARIMPNDGNKVFTLSNFVSTELEIILHDVDVEDLVDQVKVSIGTITESSSLGDTYEWIPLGIFNIQNQPVVNDNKVTLKLRDNRVKFDFNYNGQTLIESLGGIATKRQILEDICSQAGVTHEIDSFKFENDAIGVYDDTITATKYISYLADQCGCTPTINRDGHLIFIDYNNLFTWRIPKSILPSPFEVGTPFEIQRVVYESGIIKYESSNDDTLETLYLDTNNMYIDRQTQIDYIYNLLNGFTLDSVTTQKMLGNPAIDPYDFIEIYDDSDVNETIIAKTLANNTYVFNGKHSNIFQTAIGKEQRKENVSIKGQSSFERWAKTKIDNIEGTVEIQTGKVETLENNQDIQYLELTNKFNNYVTLDNINTITNQVTQLQTDTYTKTQIQQIANGDGYDYSLTTDTNYLADKEYYSYDDTNKTYTLLIAGTDYTVGDAISGDVYNKYSLTVTAVISTEAQFDADGMHYSKTGADTSSTINEIGLRVDDKGGNEIFFSGYDNVQGSLTEGTSIVRSDNLNVKTYLQVGNNKGRFEEYTDDDRNTGVGFFLT